MSIELIAKIAPKNDGFVGMVDADQVIGGVEGGTLPDNTVAESNVTQHEDAIDHDALTNTHDLEGTSILSSGPIAAGHVLTADGLGASAWAAGGGGYTDENAQDAVGAMCTDGSLVYVDATPLLTRGALTGDVTAAQGSGITAIADDAVTYAKMQNTAGAPVVLGKAEAPAGQIEERTTGDLTAVSPISLDYTRQVIGGAAAISHVATDGNIHLPSGGTANQLLKNSGVAGTGAWGTVTENAGALGAVASISGAAAIDLKPSDETDDYLQLLVDAGYPVIKIIGGHFVDFRSDDDTGVLVAQYQDGTHYFYHGYQGGATDRGLIYCTHAIDLKPSNDDDDYLRLQTVNNVPEITTVGGCDLRLSCDSGGKVSVGVQGTERDLVITGDIYDDAATPSPMLRNEQIGMFERCVHIAGSLLAVGNVIPILPVFDKLTMLNLIAETDTGTADFNLEWRNYGSVETAGGTKLKTASDYQAVDAGMTEITSFDNPTCDGTSPRKWLVATITALASATSLTIGMWIKRYAA